MAKKPTTAVDPRDAEIAQIKSELNSVRATVRSLCEHWQQAPAAGSYASMLVAMAQAMNNSSGTLSQARMVATEDGAITEMSVSHYARKDA